ncbi:MAG: HAMP domain-containing protein [Bacteroidales bacterium]|nr:HAMP domain-containing protein [Bacteroidales bacterium]
MSGFRHNRISALVLAPCVTFILIVSIAAIIAFLLLSHDLTNVEIEHMKVLKASADGFSAKNNESSAKACAVLSQNFDTFYAAVAEEDENAIREKLEWVKSASNAAGYIFTDMGGNTIESTFPEATTTDLGEAIKHTISEGGFSSNAFTNSKLISYTTSVVKNNDQEPIGVIVMVSGITELGANATRVIGMETLLFSQNGCVMASMTNDYGQITLDPEIGMKCFSAKEPWIGQTEILGKEEFAAAVPIFDFNGNTIGVRIFIGNTDLTDDILSNLRICLPLLLLLFAAVFITLFRRIRNKMVKPINKLVDSIDHIAEGDLTSSIEIGKSCDEVALIASSVHKMEDKIRDLIAPIRHASDNLVNAASQMKHAADSLSNAANRQAASLEEISSSMEEMGANIQQNTDNSVQTNKLADEVAKSAVRLGQVGSASVEAIRTIADSINDINDLVSQTNILALNASVEAARAGEHGQGFGVVAKEVGRLAEQTHDTADNINNTATSSISGAEEAFAQVSDLMPRIERINSLVKEITTASIEQNTGVQQVNTAIMDLNRMTQQNAAGAEEIAASTAQIQDMARNLNNAIGTFRLEE